MTIYVDSLVSYGQKAEAGALPTALTPHCLRHTALTLLALAGVPANARMALSGHSTNKMDELYTSHAAIEDVRRAIGG
jgi:integrase